MSTWLLGLLAVLSGQTAPADGPAEGRAAFRPGAAWIVEYTPGEARCGGVPVQRIDGDPFSPALNWFEGPIPPYPAAPTLETRFEIAPDGRPRSIRVHWTNSETGVPPRVLHVESVLAGWRFPPARGVRENCLLPLGTRATPIAEASRSTRIRTAGLSAETMYRTRALSPQKDLGDACMALKPGKMAPLDATAVKVAPGRRKWAAMSFDVDASGAPTGVRTEASSGDRTLEAAGVGALTGSRFQPGTEVKGCVVAFEAFGDTMLAPDIDRSRLSRQERCKSTKPGFVRYQGEPKYPFELQQLNIEGDALIGFDVTPDGRVVRAEVLAAEPSAGFGAAALAHVRRALGDPSLEGYQGCVASIRFKIED